MQTDCGWPVNTKTTQTTTDTNKTKFTANTQIQKRTIWSKNMYSNNFGSYIYYTMFIHFTTRFAIWRDQLDTLWNNYVSANSNQWLMYNTVQAVCRVINSHKCISVNYIYSIPRGRRNHLQSGIVFRNRCLIRLLQSSNSQSHEWHTTSVAIRHIAQKLINFVIYHFTPLCCIA